jgi:hypothetical protein
MLAVRAATGDLILRPVYLHDRADLHSSGTNTAFGIGFVTDPFPPQMLAEGVYGLEFVSLSRAGLLSIVPLAAMLVTPDGIAHLSVGGKKLVRVPLPGPAWPKVGRLQKRLIGVLDDIDVLTARAARAGAPDDPAVLVLDGWALAEGEHDGAAQLAVQFSGRVKFHVALAKVARADVVQTLHLRASGPIGYEGCISLAGLPAGGYALELVKCLPAGTARQPLAHLQIDTGGEVDFQRSAEASHLQENFSHLLEAMSS